MKPSIVGLIHLIRIMVPQILFCCGEKSPNLNFRDSMVIHKTVQTDVIDLNAMDPEDLIKWKLNILRGPEKDHRDIPKDPYPTKHNLKIPAPHKESNLATNNTNQPKPLENLSENSWNNYDESEVNTQANHAQQVPSGLEIKNSKYTRKKYSQTSENSKRNDRGLILSNIKRVQRNYLVGERDHSDYDFPLNHAEKQFVDPDTIEFKKKQFNPRRFRFHDSDFNPKFNVLHGHYRDYQPRVHEQNKGRIHKFPNTYHKQFQDGNDPVQKKWTKNSFGSQTTNQKINKPPLIHHLLHPGITLTSERPLKHNDTKDSSPIVTSSGPFNLIPSFRNRSNYIESISSTQVVVNYRAVTTPKVLAIHNETIRRVNIPITYNKGQKEKDDINDVIQVDLIEDFIYKPRNSSNNASDTEPRQKKNVEVIQEKVTLWKTADLVLAVIAILTIFVLVTICMIFGSISKHAEDLEDEEYDVGCFERARKRFVMVIGFLAVYLVTCFDFALKELDDPENPKPYAQMMMEKPLIEPFRSKKKKNFRVTFGSDVPSSSSGIHPLSTATSVPTATSQSDEHSSLEQIPSKKSSLNTVPSLPTVPSNSSIASKIRRLSDKIDAFNTPSSKGFPSVTTIPVTLRTVRTDNTIRTSSEKTGTTVNSSQSSNELPSLPTVSSASSGDNFNSQPPPVVANQNLNDSSSSRNVNTRPKWLKFRKRPS